MKLPVTCQHAMPALSQNIGYPDFKGKFLYHVVNMHGRGCNWKPGLVLVPNFPDDQIATNQYSYSWLITWIIVCS